MGLKGEMTIELTNVKTGEVERVHEHNLVTNAASDIINFIANYGEDVMENNSDDAISTSMASWFRKWKLTEIGYGYITPILTNLFGGILIFDNVVEEALDNVLPPSPYNGAHNIGYANREVNTSTDTRRGSLNQTESISVTNGYRFVWDFSTSQGNGNIGSVGLTSDRAGTNGMLLDNKTIAGKYFFRWYTQYIISSSTTTYTRYAFYEHTSRALSTSYQTGNPENPSTIINDLSYVFPLDYDIDTETFYCAKVEIYDSKLCMKTFEVKSEFDKVHLRYRHGLHPYIDNVHTYDICTCTTDDGLFDGLRTIKIMKEGNKYYLTMFQPMTAPTFGTNNMPGGLGKSSLTLAIVNETTGTVEKCQRVDDLDCWSAPFATFKIDGNYLYANGTALCNTSMYGYIPYVVKINMDTMTIEDMTYFYYSDDESMSNLYTHRGDTTSSGNAGVNAQRGLQSTNNPYCEIYEKYFIKIPGYYYSYTTTTETPYWINTYDRCSIFYIEADGSMHGRARRELYTTPYGGNYPSFVFNNMSSKTVNGCFKMMLSAGYTLTTNTTRLHASAYLIEPFLMTINNLSTPVTKTADKTMKITYTIREVDE